MMVPELKHDEMETSSLLLTPQEQNRIIKQLSDHAESNLNEGQLYYVVSNRWFTSWEKYTGQDDDHAMGENSLELLDDKSDTPGPIDNSDLVSDANDGEGGNLEIIRTMVEGKNYVLVHEDVWKKLFEWYQGGPPLPRKMISQGIHRKFGVEVYPLCLKLLDSRDNSQSDIRLSKKASVRELYEKVCALKGLEPEKACIWDYFNDSKQCLLTPSEQTLEDANLQMDQRILLEIEASARATSGIGVGSTGNELALVPMEPSRSSRAIGGGPSLSNGFSSSYSSKSYPGLSSMSTDADDGHDSIPNARKKDGGGLSGLQNLGNTCFMNSALQCLVHTPPLVQYFLQNYSDEINKQNPLGTHGELAIAFGELLRNMWSAGRTTIAPRVFKGKLARFAPQFSGYNQHDSQELLAFLLDGLHEDLNRVKQKPYIEMKDADGRPDEEYANECWKNHKARNDSIIVDTCQGQYKSTLVCPVCSKISVTFDPFMYLTLPIPSSVNRIMTVTVLYGDGNGLPMPYTVTVPKHGNCRDLIQAIGATCCLKNDEGILLAEVYDHKIYRWLEIPLEPLASIRDEDHIVAYRVPMKRAGLKKLEIFHGSSEMKLQGTPLVTYLDEECVTVADLDIAIKKILSPIKKTRVAVSKFHSEEQNGCAPHDGDEIENMVLNNDVDTMCGIQLPFKLTQTDGKGSIGSQIEDNFVKSSSRLKVMLHWTDKEHELYDISYLKDLPEVCKSGFSAKKTRQEAVSLFTCLEAFLKEEPLGPDDMWYCPGCKKHRQATKKLDLWRLPEILVIHLKRFSYSRYSKNKLETFVNFQIHDLDLRKYVKCQDASGISHTYELYAISNHYGGLGGGHYTAYAKLIDDERWYDFDDSHVSPVNESDIRTSAAYVLFYRRAKSDAKPNTGESSSNHDES